MASDMRHWAQLHLIHAYHALPADEREAYFLAEADTPTIRVRRADVGHRGLSEELTIEATDTALTTEELTLDALAGLHRAAQFYPDVKTVFLGLKVRRHWPSCIRGPMAPLRAGAEGAVTLEDVLNDPDVER